MKRFLSISLVLLLSLSLLAGCTNKGSADQPDGANGGVTNSGQNSTDTNTNQDGATAKNDGKTTDDNLMDRTENAVDDMVDDTENTVDDMVDDLDPDKDKTRDNANTGNTGNTDNTTSDGTLNRSTPAR